MEEAIDALGDFYALTTSGMADERFRIVKQAAAFAVFDIHGDLCKRGFSPQGLYCQGTRYLSHYSVTLEGRHLLLLSSDVTRDNHLITVDLTNPDLIFASEPPIPKGTLHIFRSKFLWEGRCFEKYRLQNYGLEPMFFNLELIFEADFVDIFEVRGLKRRRRGKYLPVRIFENMLEFSYLGLDDVLRRTRIDFSPPPHSIEPNRVNYYISLDVEEKIELQVTASCLSDRGADRVLTSYGKAYSDSLAHLKAKGRPEFSILTSNEHFNTLIERATADLQILLTDEDGTLYPYAGIPWFSTPFGRDGLITALETLWFDPDIARSVLVFLATRQADASSNIQDAQPGKILHEIRVGEMTNCGELPFSRYYGSADATPLFVLLVGKYFRRTADRPFIVEMWPHVERALTWMDRFGDLDRDGFVEYLRRSEHGIANQGWKDSHDSIFHADGTLAEPPIAACEIQGYVYAAKKEAAFLAETLGRAETAASLLAEARRLKERFEAAFWDEQLGGYVLALDGPKRPCRVRASNMGHCLYASIANSKRAGRVAEMLMDGAFFSGWGIRTLAKGEVRYNPMSYHNGSIWPHDNALIAEGFSRYGLNRHAAAVLDALFQMSRFTELNRLPELFCGFEKRAHQGPTQYPVACSPQAWSAASPFLLLKACMGLHIDVPAKTIHLSYPYLPLSLEMVRVRNLEVGGTKLDFMVRRHRNDVSLQVFERTEDIRFIIEK